MKLYEGILKIAEVCLHGFWPTELPTLRRRRRNRGIAVPPAPSQIYEAAFGNNNVTNSPLSTQRSDRQVEVASTEQSPATGHETVWAHCGFLEHARSVFSLLNCATHLW